MKAIILAGGFGTRISEETDNKPKPMILIDILSKVNQYNCVTLLTSNNIPTENKFGSVADDSKIIINRGTHTMCSNNLYFVKKEKLIKFLKINIANKEPIMIPSK